MRKIITMLSCVLALSGCKDINERMAPLWVPATVLRTSLPSAIPSTLPMAIPTSCPTQAFSVEWHVRFSPNGGIEEFISDHIRHAQHSVYLQGYSFTSKKIAGAMSYMAPHGHSKITEVLLDKSDLTARGSVIKILLDNKVPVFIDDRHAIAHNKVILIDDNATFTGSFNFTMAAEHANAENSLYLVSPAIYKEYKHNYDFHKSHSYRLEHL